MTALGGALNFFLMLRRHNGTVTWPTELFRSGNLEEAHMPILIPVLWVGGAAILLGGGWYVIGHMVH